MATFNKAAGTSLGYQAMQAKAKKRTGGSTRPPGTGGIKPPIPQREQDHGHGVGFDYKGDAIGPEYKGRGSRYDPVEGNRRDQGPRFEMPGRKRGSGRLGGNQSVDSQGRPDPGEGGPRSPREMQGYGNPQQQGWKGSINKAQGVANHSPSNWMGNTQQKAFDFK